MALDPHFTHEQKALRAEVRAWMAERVPQDPSKTFEGAAGFALHREWERTLAQGGAASLPPCSRGASR